MTNPGAYKRRTSNERSERSPPANFDKRYFSYLADLPSSDWFYIIEDLKYQRTYWRDDKDAWIYANAEGTEPAHISTPPLWHEATDEIMSVLNNFKSTRGLLLNLAYPDAELKTAFAKYLETERLKVPYPFRRKGPRSGHGNGLSPSQIKTWIDHKIVELTMIEQSPEHQQEPYTDREIAKFVYEHMDDESRNNKIIEARRLRAKAIDYLPVISAALST